MSQLPIFEIAGGTVPGRDHSRVGKNSHDSYYWEQADGVLAAVVCDGCGSGPHSEVGAKLGAKIIVRQALRWYLQDARAFGQSVDTQGQSSKGLERVRRSVLTQIQSVVDSMGGSFSENVRDYFLFTTVGVIVDRTGPLYIFACGDGVYYVDGVPTTLVAPNNAPSYICYGLVDTEQEEPWFKVMLYGQHSASIQSILLGTDGATDLSRCADAAIPGKEEKIGPMSQFWEKDVFFKNPFAIGHRLALINRSTTRVDWEKRSMSEAHGPLKDDTTLVAIRRKKS